MVVTLGQQDDVGDKPTVKLYTYINRHAGTHKKETFTKTLLLLLFKKNLNASKPSEHPPSGEEMSEGLGGNIGCRDETSSWYQSGSPIM